MRFVRLTGHPAAVAGDDEVPFAPDKRFQLFGYLAYAGTWVGRERVAFLFWPDSDTATSRQNLRGLLQRLDTLRFEPSVEATKHQLRWQVPTDVAQFDAALARGDVAAALRAYRGPLLADVGGDEGGEFDEWLEIEREQIYSRWRSLALRRLSELGPDGAEEAADLVRRLLEADALDEEAVRAHMQALTRWGRPAEAQRAYRDLVARLDREMGMEPTSETVRVYEAAMAAAAAAPVVIASHVKAPAVAPAPPASTDRGAAVGARHRLPVPGTSFVGREAELGDVVAYLRDPACRLLSLTGHGGVGKTRLALAAAESVADEFADGAVFVPLDAVSSPEEVLPAVAAALGLGTMAGGWRWEALQARVADANLLVVIDNFEHVAAAADLLARLLAAGSGLKLLVTTRERLNLEAEWTYLLEGLDYPGPDVPLADMAAYSAVRLLLDRARRVRPGFELTEDDLPHLRSLFALTQGMPLAIELVAAWLRAAPLATLVAELEQDPGAVTAVAIDAPRRHESVRAVFEQSWSRLPEAERTALQRLTVFAGPVAPEAAAFVAGASRQVLGSLVDRSLLRLDEGGRYDRHPLLLALAREKLAEDTREERAVTLRHAAYSLRFLRERVDRAKGPRPALAQQEVHAESRELRAAMRRAARSGLSGQLVAFMQLLELDIGYFQAHGHDDETLELLSLAADAAVAIGSLDVGRDLRGRVGDVYGLHRGDRRRALGEYRRAVELARQAGDVGREAVFLSACGVMQASLSPGGGRDDLDRALAMAEGSGDPLALSTVLEHRAYVLGTEGDLEGARELFLRSRATVEDLPDPEAVHPFELTRRRFFTTLNLGHLDHQTGRLDEAVAARESALGLAQEAGNQIWEATARLELAEVQAGAGRHEEAALHLRLARELFVANHVTVHLRRIAEFAAAHGYDLEA